METKKEIRWWVTATDKMFTNAAYGTKYEGKTIKRVYECETLQQARTLRNKMEMRAKKAGLTHVNICTTKPNYPSNRYAVFTYPYSDDIWNW